MHGFLSCRECGHVVKCPHCDVLRCRIIRDGKMVCHYCGYEADACENTARSAAPDHIGEFQGGNTADRRHCKSTVSAGKSSSYGHGHNKTERSGHEKILSAFANGEADVLVGTQMIVKGHDFPNVTLVGVLAADMSLYTDDYQIRARERSSF